MYLATLLLATLHLATLLLASLPIDPFSSLLGTEESFKVKKFHLKMQPKTFGGIWVDLHPIRMGLVLHNLPPILCGILRSKIGDKLERIELYGRGRDHQ